MISLPVLLVFEEERMKIKITNWWWLKQFLNQELLNDNGKIHHFHIYIKKKKKNQRKWPNKQRYNGKPKYACYVCGRFGHIRINYPNYNNNNKNNESK